MLSSPHRVRLVTFLFAAALMTGFCLQIQAQKQPIAFDKNSPLSSFNKKEYLEIANRYRASPNKADRDRLLFKAVTQIDLNFRLYQRNRRIGRDSLEIFLDVLEAGAVAATSITYGVRAKSIINDGLAMLKGSRTSINKNLRLLELQVLFNRMRADRAGVMERILINIGKSDQDYPFERAFLDIVDYYAAGTMDNALSGLANETGKTAVKAEEDLEKKKKLIP
jgi:hypothetical protein